MKIALAFLAVAVTYASAQIRPCGGPFNIFSCTCDNAASTAVAHPRMCKNLDADVVSCTCKDDSEWRPPCGGYQNIIGCAPNEETGTIECNCADGTTFNPVRGGRGRGRGGRGGNGGGNGEGNEDGDDNEEEGDNGGRGRGRGGRGN